MRIGLHQDDRFWLISKPDEVAGSGGKTKTKCWMAFSSDNIGPFWFENTNSYSISVTQDSYLNLLEKEVIPCLGILRDI